MHGEIGTDAKAKSLVAAALAGQLTDEPRRAGDVLAGLGHRLLSLSAGRQAWYCCCKHFRVIYTRPYWGGRIMRRRECRHFGKRMTTWEKLAFVKVSRGIPCERLTARLAHGRLYRRLSLDLRQMEILCGITS